MIKNVLAKSILILFLSIGINSLSAQVQQVVIDAQSLNDSNPFDVSQCTNIIVGSEFQFTRVTGNGCGGNFGLIEINGSAYEINTSNNSFDYTFNNEGSFLISCGITPPGSVGVTIPSSKVCYTVSQAQTVPTMGEWGLISLSLLLLITMAVAFKSDLSKTKAARI